MKNGYEVKSPLWSKILITTGYLASYVAMTFDSKFSFMSMWNSEDIIGIIAFIFFFCIFPLIIMVVLFTKTVFMKTEIIHTNFILQNIRKKYENIENVKVTKHSDIKLHFVDGTSIKVLTGQNQLSKTLKIIEKNIEFNLR